MGSMKRKAAENKENRVSKEDLGKIADALERLRWDQRRDVNDQNLLAVKDAIERAFRVRLPGRWDDFAEEDAEVKDVTAEAVASRFRGTIHFHSHSAFAGITAEATSKPPGARSRTGL